LKSLSKEPVHPQELRLFSTARQISPTPAGGSNLRIEQMNRDGKYFVPYIVAYDGIAIIVNRSLAIENITLQQLYDIYSGKVTTWNQIDSSLQRLESFRSQGITLPELSNTSWSMS
jgi:ABC-type phosphate transport system substrate-binding protein